MKKTVILLGGPGSGKSHIAKAIELQHGEQNILYLYSVKDLKNLKKQHTLVVVEGVSKSRILDVVREMESINPKVRSVFVIQEKIESFIEYADFAYCVNCNYDLV